MRSQPRTYNNCSTSKRTSSTYTQQLAYTVSSGKCDITECCQTNADAITDISNDLTDISNHLVVVDTSINFLFTVSDLSSVSNLILDLSQNVYDNSQNIIELNSKVEDLSGLVYDLSDIVYDLSGIVYDISGEFNIISTEFTDLSSNITDLSGIVDTKANRTGDTFTGLVTMNQGLKLATYTPGTTTQTLYTSNGTDVYWGDERLSVWDTSGTSLVLDASYDNIIIPGSTTKLGVDHITHKAFLETDLSNINFNVKGNDVMDVYDNSLNVYKPFTLSNDYARLYFHAPTSNYTGFLGMSIVGDFELNRLGSKVLHTDGSKVYVNNINIGELSSSLTDLSNVVLDLSGDFNKSNKEIEDLSGIVTDLSSNKVNRAGDTMTGNLNVNGLTLGKSGNAIINTSGTDNLNISAYDTMTLDLSNSQIQFLGENYGSDTSRIISNTPFTISSVRGGGYFPATNWNGSSINNYAFSDINFNLNATNDSIMSIRNNRIENYKESRFDEGLLINTYTPSTINQKLYTSNGTDLYWNGSIIGNDISAVVYDLSGIVTDISASLNDLSTVVLDLSGDFNTLSTAFIDLSSVVTDISASLNDLSTVVLDLSGDFNTLSTVFIDLSGVVTDVSASLSDLSAVVLDLSGDFNTLSTAFIDLSSNKVSKSGDTMTGNLTIDKSNPTLTLEANNSHTGNVYMSDSGYLWLQSLGHNVMAMNNYALYIYNTIILSGNNDDVVIDKIGTSNKSLLLQAGCATNCDDDYSIVMRVRDKNATKYDSLVIDGSAEIINVNRPIQLATHTPSTTSQKLYTSNGTDLYWNGSIIGSDISAVVYDLSTVVLDLSGDFNTVSSAFTDLSGMVTDLSIVVLDLSGDFNTHLIAFTDLSSVVADVSATLNDLSGFDITDLSENLTKLGTDFIDLSGVVADLSAVVLDLSGDFNNLSTAFTDLSGIIVDLSGIAVDLSDNKVSKSGDTMTGNLNVNGLTLGKSGNAIINTSGTDNLNISAYDTMTLDLSNSQIQFLGENYGSDSSRIISNTPFSISSIRSGGYFPSTTWNGSSITNYAFSDINFNTDASNINIMSIKNNRIENYKESRFDEGLLINTYTPSTINQKLYTSNGTDLYWNGSIIGSDISAVVYDLSDIVADLSAVVLDLSGDFNNLSTAFTDLSGAVADLSGVVDTKVSKSGDTMTGNLTIDKSNPTLTLEANNSHTGNVYMSDSGYLWLQSLGNNVMAMNNYELYIYNIIILSGNNDDVVIDKIGRSNKSLLLQAGCATNCDDDYSIIMRVRDKNATKYDSLVIDGSAELIKANREIMLTHPNSSVRSFINTGNSNTVPLLAAGGISGGQANTADEISVGMGIRYNTSGNLDIVRYNYTITPDPLMTFYRGERKAKAEGNFFVGGYLGISGEGILLDSSIPASTTNRLYRSGSDLYWDNHTLSIFTTSGSSIYADASYNTLWINNSTTAQIANGAGPLRLYAGGSYSHVLDMDNGELRFDVCGNNIFKVAGNATTVAPLMILENQNSGSTETSIQIIDPTNPSVYATHGMNSSGVAFVYHTGNYWHVNSSTAGERFRVSNTETTSYQNTKISVDNAQMTLYSPTGNYTSYSQMGTDGYYRLNVRGTDIMTINDTDISINRNLISYNADSAIGYMRDDNWTKYAILQDAALKIRGGETSSFSWEIGPYIPGNGESHDLEFICNSGAQYFFESDSIFSISNTNAVDATVRLISTSGSQGTTDLVCNGTNFKVIHRGSELFYSNGTNFYFSVTAYASSGQIVTSDKRIKKNIQEIKDDSALQIVKKLEPKTYGYVDPQKGDDTVYGFIAQEIQEIFPPAVKIERQVIPDILKNISISGDVITFETDIELIIGNQVQIRESSEKNYGKETTILSKIDSKTYTISDVLEYTTGYCYGNYVDDFHYVMKERLVPILWSATQQVIKDKETLTTEVKTLKTENTTLKQKVADLETENADIKARLRRIEEILNITTT